MKVSIIGSSGFIGKFLSNHLSKNFDILNINIRNENISELREELINQIFSSEIIINCAASLNPITQNDYFLNENFISYLINLNIKFKRKIIHLSSINTLIEDRLDNYSISKRKSEKMIENKENLFLIRLPLVYQKENNIIQSKGNVSKIFNYLKMKLPVYPMIYPGHLYQPIEIEYLKNTILEIIRGSEIRNEMNLVGSKKIYLWDIFKEIAENEKKRTLKLDLRYVYKLLPTSLKSIIKKQNNFIQQIASIDHSNFK